jgi:anti-anti-sigma factor
VKECSVVEAFTVEVMEDGDGVAVVALVGELDVVGAPVLDKHLAQLCERVRCVRFDASGLDLLSAAGLRSILAAEHRLGRGRVMVDNAPKMVHKVLAACDLLHLIDVTPSVSNTGPEGSGSAQLG